MAHFNPVKNIRHERFVFWSRQMKENEEIEDFILTIKHLASSCDYRQFLDQMLTDKLILSLRDPQLQKKLMDESMDTTFAKICTTAINAEMIRKNVEDIQQQSVNLNRVGYRRSSETKEDRRSNFFRSNSNIRSRLRPGFSRYAEEGYKNRTIQRENTEGNAAKFQYKCFECGKRGHVQRNCPKKRQENNNYRGRFDRSNSYQNRGNRVNAVNEDSSDEGSDDKDVLETQRCAVKTKWKW